MDELIRMRVEAAIDNGVFPGCQVGYIKNGITKVLTFGHHTYDVDSPEVTERSIYDIASITKAIPTGCLALKLISEGKLSTEDLVIKYLPEYNNQYKNEVKIKHLLTYSVVTSLDYPLSSLINESPDKIIEIIMKAPLKAKPGEMFLYTNAPIILLGMIIERIFNERMDEIAKREFFEPLGMSNTSFHPENLDKDIIVPTEISETRGVIHGFVLDEVTWALQKKYVPGCAGVFSNASDLLNFAEIMLSNGCLKNKKYFSEEIMTQMHTNQLGSIGVSYGLGWELNQPRFMGRDCDDTIGKTGFTGTMILINKRKQSALVLLSNYTYPKRKPDGVLINEVRADLANIIFNS